MRLPFRLCVVTVLLCCGSLWATIGGATPAQARQGTAGPWWAASVWLGSNTARMPSQPDLGTHLPPSTISLARGHDVLVQLIVINSGRLAPADATLRLRLPVAFSLGPRGVRNLSQVGEPCARTASRGWSCAVGNPDSNSILLLDIGADRAAAVGTTGLLTVCVWPDGTADADPVNNVAQVSLKVTRAAEGPVPIDQNSIRTPAPGSSGPVEANARHPALPLVVAAAVLLAGGLALAISGRRRRC